MLFTDFPLDDRLQRALVTAGFVTPTPIQAAVLPVALAGRDLLGTAQTGTGKTAAYVLPILEQLLVTPLADRKSRAVILAPTRELVEQILAVIRELGIHTNVRAVAVYGGVSMHQQTRALRNGVELIVACPGRLLDHMKRRTADLRQLDYLVLDEADRMLDMGFLPAIQEIIDLLPAKRQTMLFTATFPKLLNPFVQQVLRDPVRLQVDNAVAAQTVRHSLYQVKSTMKPRVLSILLRQLIPESDAVLIFTQTRVTANEVARHLYAEGMDADVLHAEKTQRERQDTLDRFRAGAFPYLVATDIAARGIDVTSISHVINYDLPGKADDYLHRIGRTGRMERVGHAISLMTRGDVRAVREIERMLGKNITVARLEASDAQVMSDVISDTPDGTMRQTRPHGTGRSERPRRADAVSSGSERRQPHRRDENAPVTRNARLRKSFGGENPSEQPARAEHTGRRRHSDTAPFTPKRQVRHADTRMSEEAASGPARPGHSGGKHFTGMADIARHRRKYAATKRQPGEVPTGPRPAARPESATPHAPRKKRHGGRKR